MLGGLYPGLYGLTTGAGVIEPPVIEGEEVTSTGVTVRLQATMTAIECRSLVTSLFVELTTAESLPTPTPHSHRRIRPGVRALVTSSVVEGWRKKHG
jgi:hypothetical protein